MHYQSNLDTAGIVLMSRRSQRTLRINNPAEIAVFFANVVTTPSDMPDDWVARNGNKSIFSAFRSVLPEVMNYVSRLDEDLEKWWCRSWLPTTGLSTWITTAPDKGDYCSIWVEQDSTIPAWIRVYPLEEKGSRAVKKNQNEPKI